jgi:hypothetical protein
MKTCGTCKHWGGANGPEGAERLFRDANGFAKCLRIVDGCDDEEVIDGEPAYTMDGSGYLSSIRTTESFGCVLWEPKQ